MDRNSKVSKLSRHINNQNVLAIEALKSVDKYNLLFYNKTIVLVNN